MLGQQLLCPWVIDDGDHIGRGPPGVPTQGVENIEGFLAPQGALARGGSVPKWIQAKPDLSVLAAFGQFQKLSSLLCGGVII